MYSTDIGYKRAFTQVMMFERTLDYSRFSSGEKLFGEERIGGL